MSPERWQRVEQLYHLALERGAPERAQYLAEACQDDEELHREVESLLATEGSPRRILDGTAMLVPAVPQIEAGTELGPYRIEGVLGEGGMGVVYRAMDSKLNRVVALKTLPPEFARDTERRARFLREAQALGALNHPHIASIYGIEDTTDTHAIIMELVEGPTLAERIAAAPMSTDVAIDIARQVCSALEAAHEKGIVHRDLKPANIKVSEGGQVKLLDFGLAAISAPNTTESTATPVPVDNSGVILGTAAYMSPEQARGRKVDKRADIFAFGCVLFELLAGKMAFPGADVQEILAAVVKTDPDWRALPAETPAHVRRVLDRCLQKDPQRRIRDIGDVAFELDQTGTLPSEPLGSTKFTRPLMWMIAGATLAVSVLAISSRSSQNPPQGSVVRSSIVLTSSQEQADFGWHFALSPDGRYLAFVGRRDGHRTLRLRNMQSGEIRTIPSNSAALPFFSPDSRHVAYFSELKLWKADLSGGQPQVICDAPTPGGGTWNQDGVIIFANRGEPLRRVSASGGVASPVTDIKDTGGNSHRLPVFLPDGKRVLYFVRAGQNQSGGIYVLDLEANKSTKFMESDSAVAYANGHILFVRGSTLFAQPIDLSLKLTGEPIPIVQGVEATSQLTGLAPFAASQTGLLTFGQNVGAEQSQLTWFDRFGKRIATLGDPMSIREIRLSPDGKRLAVTRYPKGVDAEIWTFDLAAGTSGRFTLDSRGSIFPAWSHDGSRLSFTHSPGGLKTHWKPSNGSGGEEELFDGGRVSDWSPDGRYFSFISQSRLHIAPAERNRKPELLSEVSGSSDGVFAPVQRPGGGYFVAYESPDPARRIRVQAYPAGGKWEVSSVEGRDPQWRRDGMELYYRSGGDLVAVPVRWNDAFAPGPGKTLFSIGRASHYAVAPDGQRFLVAVPLEQEEQQPLTLLSNWTALLQIATN